MTHAEDAMEAQTRGLATLPNQKTVGQFYLYRSFYINVCKLEHPTTCFLKEHCYHLCGRKRTLISGKSPQPLTLTSTVLFNSSSTGSVALKINVWDQHLCSLSGKKVTILTNTDNRSPAANQILKSNISLCLRCWLIRIDLTTYLWIILL